MKHAFSLAIVTLSLGAACTTSTTSTPAPLEPEPAPVPTTAPSPSSPNGTGGAAGVAGSSAGGGANGGTQEKMCGGIAAIRCPEKQYCSYAPEARCGAGDMSGTCAPIPDVCTQQLDEVCGCDGKTYGNACSAAQAGISVTMKGPCKPAASSEPAPAAEGALCGTRGAPQACAEGLYCAYKTQCGATDAGGKCTKKPNMCTKIFKPVCGCDGKTYGNACTAASAGVSVASEGKCAGDK